MLKDRTFYIHFLKFYFLIELNLGGIDIKRESWLSCKISVRSAAPAPGTSLLSKQFSNRPTEALASRWRRSGGGDPPDQWGRSIGARTCGAVLWLDEFRELPAMVRQIFTLEKHPSYYVLYSLIDTDDLSLYKVTMLQRNMGSQVLLMFTSMRTVRTTKPRLKAALVSLVSCQVSLPLVSLAAGVTGELLQHPWNMVRCWVKNMQ